MNDAMNRCKWYTKNHNLIQAKDHVLVAVSGGGDSVALLCILKQWQQEMSLTLSIVHIEHGIRGEDSRQDARFVEELGRQFQIPVYRYDIDIPMRASVSGRSIEEEARIARYESYEDCLNKIGATSVALAHHLNDNVETILFHLIRGTNVTGLIGIRPKRGIYIRPLLQTSRVEIENYLEDEGQSYCTDVTNASLDYDRNRIRHQVVPMLTELNEQASAHIADVGEQMEKVDDFLGRLCEGLYQTDVIQEGNQVSLLNALFAEEEVLINRVIYKALIEYSGKQKDWYQIHVSDTRNLATKQIGKQINLPYGVVARRESQGIVLTCNEGIETRVDRTLDANQEADGETKRHREENQIIDPSEGESVSADLDIDIEIKVPGITKIPELGIEIRTRFLEYSVNSSEIPKKDCTKWLDYAIIKNKLKLGHKKSGDFLVVHKDGGRKTLKKYYIDEKIASARRKELWIVHEGNHCLWVIGKRLGEDVKITDKTTTILEITVDGGCIDE